MNYSSEITEKAYKKQAMRRRYKISRELKIKQLECDVYRARGGGTRFYFGKGTGSSRFTKNW